MFPKILAILALCILPAFSDPHTPIEVHKAKEPTDGRYIVILKDGISRRDHINSLSRRGILSGNPSITHEWDVINGFGGSFSTSEIESLRSNPDVLSIEEDGRIYPQGGPLQ